MDLSLVQFLVGVLSICVAGILCTRAVDYVVQVQGNILGASWTIVSGAASFIYLVIGLALICSIRNFGNVQLLFATFMVLTVSGVIGFVWSVFQTKVLVELFTAFVLLALAAQWGAWILIQQYSATIM